MTQRTRQEADTVNKLTRNKLQRGALPKSRSKAGRRLLAVRMGSFRLISCHYMRGLRYWQAGD